MVARAHLKSGRGWLEIGLNMKNSILRLHNRMAVDGDRLVTHRFPDGMISMLSRSDFEDWSRTADRSEPESAFRRFLASLKNETFPSDGEPGPVVQVPSEALLRIFDIAPDWREQYHFDAWEDALFAGSSTSAGAPVGMLLFGNGVTVPFQSLHEAQNVTVIRDSWPESLEPYGEPASAGVN